MNYRVDIKLLPQSATDEKYLEEYYYSGLQPATAGSSGLDIVNPISGFVPLSPTYEGTPNSDPLTSSQGRCEYGFRIAAAMYDSFGNRVSYFLMPRSSFGKLGLFVGNSIGLIDSDYNGELMANIYNNSHRVYMIKEGTRLFQIVSPTLGKITEVNVVTELPHTARGTAGLGSTGQ